MVGRVKRADPATMDTRGPTTARSTGLPGKALVISASSRPDTRTRWAGASASSSASGNESSVSTETVARVETS
jgi:hypothetical protein